MINKILFKTNTVIIAATLLNILGLLLVVLSAFNLTPLTLIISLTVGGPLIFISLIIFLLVVIIDEKKRRITE